MRSKLQKLLGPRPVRRTIVVAVGIIIVLLLLGNTVLVNQQDAPATGDSTLPVEGGEIHAAQDGPSHVHAGCGRVAADRPARGRNRAARGTRVTSLVLCDGEGPAR